MTLLFLVRAGTGSSTPDVEVVPTRRPPVLTRARQTNALRAAREEVEAFRLGLVEGLPAEVAATHLRSAETALEELLGIVSVDDVLDVVFREFCVGRCR